MNILLVSHFFSPSIGGIESISEMLAREFVLAGHKVKLVTDTHCVDSDEGRFPFPVIRQPTFLQLMRLTLWADIVFHNNICLRMSWPLLFIRRPWVVTHQTWLPKRGGFSGALGRIKRFVLHWATGVAISQAIADDIKTPCLVIHNPYDAEIFRLLPEVRKQKDLVFVGRLVHDKGLATLIAALRILKEQGKQPGLTVIGLGPDEADFLKLSEELGLTEQVEFIGSKKGESLAEAVSQHKVMVAPSLWHEPFGIVALEGMACGCVVVGSERGGLQEAIGPGGLTFPNGDSKALATCIELALYNAGVAACCRAAAPEHLTAHSASAVAHRYLELFTHTLVKHKHYHAAKS